MDAQKLEFGDEILDYSIGNALVFVLPNEGRDALGEMYRTLKPGGIGK